jgi:hypothetical protein
MKQLTDFSEFVECHDAVRRAEAELQKINDRRSEIQVLLSAKKPKQDIGDEWDVFKAGGGSEVCACTGETELREEYQYLEEKEKFVTKALKQGRQELDKIHGRCSLKICQAHRPLFVDQVRKVLEALKAICQANATLEQLRSDLEANGVRTGSLATGVFELGGDWNSEFGGRVVGYQRYISDNYPELAGAAGQDVKGKLRELAEKTKTFVGGET